MSEPYLPVPGPEPNSNWDPAPAHCPECGRIIGAHPASRKDGLWEGWCEEHGTVAASYGDACESSEVVKADYRDAEDLDEERRERESQVSENREDA